MPICRDESSSERHGRDAATQSHVRMCMQVANWFVNYRGRQWQPLVLELAAEIEAEDAAAAAAVMAAGVAPGA